MCSPTDLLGTWRLTRHVHDRRLGEFGSMTGTLTLLAASGAGGDGGDGGGDGGDADVRWLERGRFVFAGRCYDSVRELRLVHDGTRWQMHFADGRVFHPWTPGTVVTHPCRADTYRGLVDVDAGATRLRTLWDVTGPAKDQRLITRCYRA